MDKTILIAGLIAAVAIIAIAAMLIMSEEAPKTEAGSTNDLPTTGDDEKSKETETRPVRKPVVTIDENITYENKTFGVMQKEVLGDCVLYKQLGSRGAYACYGTAGNYSTTPPQDYRQTDASNTTYFCKGTVYGCKLYQKVLFE